MAEANKRAGNVVAAYPLFQEERGGSIPTINAWRRWQVARATRDGKLRTAGQIAELVGFDPTECLAEEKRPKNFARVKNKWRLTPAASESLERHETTPRVFKRLRRVKPKELVVKPTQGELF